MKKLILITLVLLSSCGSKKVITKTVVKKQIDTVFVAKIVEVVKEQKNEISIDNLCDTIKGSKEVDLKLNNGNTRVVIKNNTLYVEANTDSIRNVLEKEYIAKYKENKSKNTSEKIIYKWSKYTWIFLFSTIILLLVLFSRLKNLFPNII